MKSKIVGIGKKSNDSNTKGCAKIGIREGLPVEVRLEGGKRDLWEEIAKR